MRVICAPGVTQSAREVQRSTLFSNWANRLHGIRVGDVIVYAVHAWGGEIRMLQLGVNYGKFQHAVFLRGATVDMLTTVTDGRNRCAVFVEQPRVAVGQVVRSNPAGMVDIGESATAAALREVAEEVGAHIKWGKATSMHPGVLSTLAPLLVSPGGADEEATFYVVEGYLSAAELKRLAKHIGGLAHEGERLKLKLVPCTRFNVGTLLREVASVQGRPDMKAVLSLLMYDHLLRTRR